MQLLLKNINNSYSQLADFKLFNFFAKIKPYCQKWIFYMYN
jgi:hypothetical protein